MYVVVKVRIDAALGLRSCVRPGQMAPGYSEISKVAKDLGIVLEPMYPDEDLCLASYFVVEAPDSKFAEQVVSGLLGCGAVESASIESQPSHT